MSRPKAKVAACGTPSGYRRHRNRGEEACPACRKAVVLANRAMYVRRLQRGAAARDARAFGRRRAHFRLVEVTTHEGPYEWWAPNILGDYLGTTVLEPIHDVRRVVGRAGGWDQAGWDYDDDTAYVPDEWPRELGPPTVAEAAEAAAADAADEAARAARVERARADLVAGVDDPVRLARALLVLARDAR